VNAKSGSKNLRGVQPRQFRLEFKACGVGTQTVRAEGAEVMRYAIVIEKAAGNYSAYVPDLPGCVATAATIAEVESEIRDAIRFHIDGLKADGAAVPAPTSIAEYVDA
jgi:predicted RNase H-like HicB family nuclease